MLLLLDVMGYVPNVTQQKPDDLMGNRINIGPIPAVLLALGVVFAYKYLLDRDRFASVVAELAERRAAARGAADVKS